ncbi:MAG: exodeoxyribonuclease V subunit gamma [Rhodanobacteraceae bacterium]|nr:exodeoxyribonuclease V subunit gamma [Rhodanobacteraceae bacterium]
MEARPTGMVVYRASRLEALLQPLEGVLAKYPPPRLLASQTVLAAHPGMKRWLGLALARRRGPKSIVANLDICLPTTWFESRVRDELGVSAISLQPYRREALCWRIHEMLPSIKDATIDRYLGTHDGRRRFQLADRIAAIFTRYMIYRPDWLSQWQAGRDDIPEPNFLAPIWRRLRSEIGVAHRGELIAQLIERRRRAPSSTPAEPVHVFGLSHLPPSELAILRAESLHRLVVMYVPDPSVEFWAGLGNDRARLAQMLQLGVSDESERELLSLGHPLLSAWGRMGHHFGIRLHESVDDVVLETRHGEDRDQRPESLRLLHRLQQDIRLMTSDLLQPTALLAPDARQDDSLRIHGCHTRDRELEVLHDAIRDALACDPELNPSDILVMSPMIAEYASLVPSVFASRRTDGKGLPYHLADVPLRRTHDIFDAFAMLLATPVSRVSAPQVLDLLRIPAIGRALGVAGNALERLRVWLTAARVAWGLDAASRQRLGLPAFGEHSFGWGMDRLLGGYIYGDRVPEDVAELVNLWPVDGVSGVEVDALGALDRLLIAIDRIAGLADAPRPLSQWNDELHAVLKNLFRADFEAQAEREAVIALESAIESLKAGIAPGIDPAVDFAVVRDLLNECLDAIPDRQPYLLGGITFSGMVPQRSIPFRMLALLGMNDGEFPRTTSDGGIDLMTRHSRLGDRDVRNDDRYLFLETVMAARSRLHISFLSEGVRDGKPRNPSAMLAELMAYLDGCSGLRGSLESCKRPWFVQHPLQPFDMRYFDSSDPALFSYEQRFARMVRSASPVLERFVPPPPADLVNKIVGASAVVAEVSVSLDRLRTYFRRPSESLLKRNRQLRLDALEDDTLGDSEPLQASFNAIDRIPRTLVFDALAASNFDIPARAPNELRLSGLMPPGSLGDQAYAQARRQATAILDIARIDRDLHTGLAGRHSLDLGQRIGSFVIDGASRSVYPATDGVVLLDVFPSKVEAALGFNDKLPLFLEWALLRLKYPDMQIRVILLTAPNMKPSPPRWDDELNKAGARCDDDALRRRVERMLRLWHSAQTETTWYFPATSWAVAIAKPRTARSAGRKQWEEGAFSERDRAPGYASVHSRGADLFTGIDWINLEGVAQMLRECITFAHADAGDTDE